MAARLKTLEDVSGPAPLTPGVRQQATRHKNIMKSNCLLLSFGAAFAVAGCASTASQQSHEKAPPKASRVQILMYDKPRPKTDHLDVYDADPPQRPYDVIALLTCEGAVDQEVVMSTAIHYRARQIGADAVMKLSTVTAYQQSGSIYAGSLGQQAMMSALGVGGTRARSVFRANAIVYADKDSLVGKDSLTKGTPTPTPASQIDAKVASDLIGHWESIAFKGASEGVSKLEFTFLQGNKVVSVTTQNGKAYSQSGRFSVQGGKLIIVSDQDTRPDALNFSLVGDYLTVSLFSGEKAVFKRTSE